jgi:hypothetical protein
MITRTRYWRSLVTTVCRVLKPLTNSRLMGPHKHAHDCTYTHLITHTQTCWHTYMITLTHKHAHVYTIQHTHTQTHQILFWLESTQSLCRSLCSLGKDGTGRCLAFGQRHVLCVCMCVCDFECMCTSLFGPCAASIKWHREMLCIWAATHPVCVCKTAARIVQCIAAACVILCRES